MSLLPHPPNGFSVVEFLIALSLGTLLIGGMLLSYIGTKETYNIQTGIARIQETGRFINFYVNKEVRMAGFQGCTNLKKVSLTNQAKNPNVKIDFSKSIYGYEGNNSSWSPALPTYITSLGAIKPGTDVLEIRGAGSIAVNLRNDMSQPNSAIVVYDRIPIQAGDPLIITDCAVGDLFIAGANSNASAIAHGSNNNISPKLSKAYDTEAQVLKYQYSAFYIKDSGRINSSGQIIYSLYAQDLNGNEIELAEGVEDLQVTYGVDVDGDDTADSYLTAAQVTAANQWESVISVNINKLLNSVEEVNPKIQAYRFNGASITPNDRKLRREWNSYVTLRNRGAQ